MISGQNIFLIRIELTCTRGYVHRKSMRTRRECTRLTRQTASLAPTSNINRVISVRSQASLGETSTQAELPCQCGQDLPCESNRPNRIVSCSCHRGEDERDHVMPSHCANGHRERCDRYGLQVYDGDCRTRGVATARTH